MTPNMQHAEGSVCSCTVLVNAAIWNVILFVVSQPKGSDATAPTGSTRFSTALNTVKGSDDSMG